MPALVIETTPSVTPDVPVIVSVSFSGSESLARRSSVVVTSSTIGLVGVVDGDRVVVLRDDGDVDHGRIAVSVPSVTSKVKASGPW